MRVIEASSIIRETQIKRFDFALAVMIDTSLSFALNNGATSSDLVI